MRGILEETVHIDLPSNSGIVPLCACRSLWCYIEIRVVTLVAITLTFCVKPNIEVFNITEYDYQWINQSNNEENKQLTWRVQNWACVCGMY